MGGAFDGSVQEMSLGRLFFMCMMVFKLKLQQASQ